MKILCRDYAEEFRDEEKNIERTLVETLPIRFPETSLGGWRFSLDSPSWKSMVTSPPPPGHERSRGCLHLIKRGKC